MILQVGAIDYVSTFFESLGIPPETAHLLENAVVAAVIFVVAFVALYVLGKRVFLPLLGRAMDARNLDRHARLPIRKGFWFIYLFLGVTVAFGVAGYDDFLRSFATIAAAATLAVGFALQEVLKNLVAGVFIFTDRPFKIGDWIEWNDNVGIVEDISMRVTRVRTFDNELLTVPNSQLTENVVKNPVDGGRLRLKADFGIGYDDDVEEATQLMLETADEQDGIMDDPAPTVRLVELGDSSVGLQARIWIDDPSRSDFVKIRADYVTSVKERFDEAGIEIPYPHRTLTGGIELASELEAIEVADSDEAG